MDKSTEGKPHGARLQHIPKDIWDIIVDRRAELSKRTGNHISIEFTIYNLIRQINGK